jgi:hypothetical protein
MQCPDLSLDLLNNRISFFGVGPFGEDVDEESFEGTKQVLLSDASSEVIEIAMVRVSSYSSV